MLKGYWNGEPTATFEGVNYRVEKAETPTWWQNRVVGTIRQGILITYAGETWLIDNEHGDGYFKVTEGMGSPRCGHKSLGGYTIIDTISDSEIKTAVDRDGLTKEELQHDKWMQENFPETFERLQSLKRSLISHRETYKL
jgi:hypothetical protein